MVVGLGPGGPEQRTAEAEEALAGVQAVYGYSPYVARLADVPGRRIVASDNREEIARAREALAEGAAGQAVAIVSGGDPGVFAMAAAVAEVVEAEPAFASVPVRVVPGVTAMLALAARVGAPLGHDFCALSLSDNLKPWEVIAMRLEAAARAGFVIALYNPISRSRPWQLAAAFEVLADALAADTPVVFGRAVGRPDERVVLAPLSEAATQDADMATCVIVGSAATRVVERPGGRLIYTPRRHVVSPA